jgi:peptidoglycan/LPS O-acetylase OafA/YrhL
MVIITHAQAGLLHSHLYRNWAWMGMGVHGVAIFFVLSGYLISSRLFHEDSLKHFYIRRAFRLWPVAWTYLACVALVAFILRLQLIGIIDAVPCLLFFRNYVPNHEESRWALTSHFWSLSVEEQFYLVWPALLILSGRRALWLALVGIVGFSLYESTWPYAALLIGCALAFAVKQPAFRECIQKHHLWIFPVCLTGFLFCLAYDHRNIRLLESLLIAVMLGCTSLNSYRWLEWKPLAEIGVYSYSLYVWQELLLITHSGGLGIAFLPVVAVASYYLIERPCIQFGARIVHKKAELAQEPFSALG